MHPSFLLDFSVGQTEMTWTSGYLDYGPPERGFINGRLRPVTHERGTGMQTTQPPLELIAHKGGQALIATKVTTMVHNPGIFEMGTQHRVTICPDLINDYSIINMPESLKIVSYNCRGFPKTSHKLREKPTIGMLLNNENIDIMCLQETFLSKQDLSCLNVIHKDFQGVGTSNTDTRDRIIVGHPNGGVAILYKVKHSKCISPIHFNLDWVIGISIDNGSNKHVILCVYLKCVSGGQEDHNEIFQGQLEELKLIIGDLDTTSVTIIGDWNADLVNASHSHGPLLRQFTNDNGLIISSEQLLSDDSFTFISEMKPGETSWIDHCVSTQDGHNIINDMCVRYDLTCRDHIPLIMNLDIDRLPTVENEINDVSPKINWDNYDAVKLSEYSLMSDIHISRVLVPNEALDCRDPVCTDKNHILQTKTFYNNICKCLVDSSNDVFGIQSKKQFNCRPGFNEHVKDLHDIARKRFVAWRNANRPRDPNNPFFREMSVSRARFKLALRFIKHNENQLRQDAIANALCDVSEGKFWKEIKKLAPNNLPLPTNIDDATGKIEIAEMWKDHFKNLLNCVQGKECNNNFSSTIFDPNSMINSGEIEDAINKLAEGKSCGVDGIYAEHLKHCSTNYKNLIARCFTSFLIHGFLPESLMSVVLVPIIKDKSGKINSKDNYRPIAIASTVSKLLEILLLERLSNYLLTTSHQFGFKAKHSTDACIYVLKEAVDFYVSQKSSVYLCFLDASKAFDRVNHHVLFDKLIKRGVPSYLVRILCYWYSNQKMSVRWGSIMSDSFNVSNGVRQGGILSPYLFNIYMDDLSYKLRKKYAGCKIANLIINHLFYADDLVLLCPSYRGMQELLETCEKYASENDIIFNTKKSVVLIRRSNVLKKAFVQPFNLCGEKLIEVNEAKYLGHLITADGKDEKDMVRACRQLYAQGNSLIRKFHMCTETVKIKLFVTYCMQFYCAQLWYFTTINDTYYKKLNVAYNNVFRFFLRLPRDEDGRPCSASGMFVTRKIKSFQEILRNVVLKFRCRLDASENELVKSTLFRNVANISKLRKHWTNLLHNSRAVNG